MPEIILHLKAPDVQKEDLRGRHLKLYRKLAGMCASKGVTMKVAPRDPDIRIGTRSIDDNRFDDGNLHIIDDRSLKADGVLNASASYFWDFWHIDPNGTKAFSSIGDLAYEESSVSYRWAKDFFGMLRHTYLHQRQSKYGQPQDVEPQPDGAIAVFFQGDYPRVSGATSLSDIDVLKAVLSVAGDRPVVAKPHPHAAVTKDIAEAESLAQSDPRLRITNANVHDILASCCMTASINSTVALEGYLHRKPALLFGQSDFHHMAYSVPDLAQTHQALERATDHEGGFAQYLTWYFKRQCLWLARSSVEDDIWSKFADAGFPLARLKGN